MAIVPVVRDRNRIKKIAAQIRQEMEELQNSYGENGDCTFGWRDDLCGLCAIAAYRLCHSLVENGFTTAKFCRTVSPCTIGHCFVKVNGHIVDVTATQFGHDPIVLKPIRDPDNLPYYWKYHREVDLEDVEEDTSDWDQDQHPTRWKELLTNE